MLTFEHESTIQAPAARVFAFHERPEALKMLIPPGEPIRIVEHTGGIRDGAKVVLEMGYRPFTLRWVARHKGYVAGKQFQDFQERGPFRSWLHTHTVIPITEDTCVLRDHIDYELPLGKLGLIGKYFVGQKLLNTFVHRHGVTARETASTL